jgi:hypothetical protein
MDSKSKNIDEMAYKKEMNEKKDKIEGKMGGEEGRMEDKKGGKKTIVRIAMASLGEEEVSFKEYEIPYTKQILGKTLEKEFELKLMENGEKT